MGSVTQLRRDSRLKRHRPGVAFGRQTRGPSPGGSGRDQLGSVVEKILLTAVTFSFFAAGMVVMATGARLVYAMARDVRFPFHRTFRRVNPRTHTPIPATIRASADVAIVSKGLAEGEQVVVDGQNQLRAGSKVIPRPSAQPARAPREGEVPRADSPRVPKGPRQ